MADITGDQRIQSEVLEGLATAVNHRRWFVELALPYLGDNPIEIGSGLGDYAVEWAEHTPRFTATEADKLREIYAGLGTRLSSRNEKREVTAAFAGAGAVLLVAAGALSMAWFGRLL